MKRKLYFAIGIALLLIIPITMEKEKKNLTIEIPTVFQIQKTSEVIGNLKISRIHLEEPLYKVDSEENTIEKHITILKESIPPTEDESILILAAHSGTGEIAYFEKLDELEIGDEILITYQRKTYQYQVKEIWEEKKNGYINLNKEKEKQLVLTTCSPKKEGYQLIVNCIEKES